MLLPFMHPELAVPWHRDFDRLSTSGHSLQYKERPGEPKGATDYELSLGKIVDTLRRDYPDFFERGPDFGIYDDSVVFELGQPFHSVGALRGKRAYSRAIAGLQALARGTVKDGTVNCTICDGAPFGHALKVPWQLHGSMLGERCGVHVSAISLYSIAPQAPQTADGRLPTLSHRIHRHCIEFLEIHPPSLRSLLLSLWWRPQLQSALALKPAL